MEGEQQVAIEAEVQVEGEEVILSLQLLTKLEDHYTESIFFKTVDVFADVDKLQEFG